MNILFDTLGGAEPGHLKGVVITSHDPKAIVAHKNNHPEVFIWASIECGQHHSTAKGNKKQFKNKAK